MLFTNNLRRLLKADFKKERFLGLKKGIIDWLLLKYYFK